MKIGSCIQELLIPSPLPLMLSPDIGDITGADDSRLLRNSPVKGKKAQDFLCPGSLLGGSQLQLSFHCCTMVKLV